MSKCPLVFKYDICHGVFKILILKAIKDISVYKIFVMSFGVVWGI